MKTFIIYILLNFLLIAIAESCTESGECGEISISKDSDQDDFKHCTSADFVRIFGKTTKIDGLNNLQRINGNIDFSDPENDEDYEISSPLIEITGFRRLESIELFNLFTSNGLPDEDVLTKFESLNNLEKAKSLFVSCYDQDVSTCGPKKIKEIRAFDSISIIRYFEIFGESLQSIPDYNKLKEAIKIEFWVPQIEKLPQFASLAVVADSFNFTYGCNFTEIEAEQHFAALGERIGEDKLVLTRDCDE